MVQYAGVADVARLVARTGADAFLLGLVDAIEADFRRWDAFEKTPRLASHSPSGVIELMPISDGAHYAFKYVNGHPANTGAGLLTVTGLGVLADVATGYPVFLCEMTLATALRTAATSVLAARHLARADSRTMALVGLGAQSEFQAMAFRAALGIDRLRVHDIDPAATAKFRANLRGSGLDIAVAANAADAVRSADIVTTATALKAHVHVLSRAMIEPGMHLNAIGGDCPGKTELDPAILRGASVFVEFLDQARVEGEIQQMPPDFPATELWRVLAGAAPGRAHAEEVTVFDSVGFAIEDFSTLRYLRDLANRTGLCSTLDLVPDLADPRNLFALLEPAPARAQALA